MRAYPSLLLIPIVRRLFQQLMNLDVKLLCGCIVPHNQNSGVITGQAADIQSVSKSKADHKKLFELAQRLRLPYDQLIDEYDYKWVHISFSMKGNRRQVLHVK